MPSPQATRGTLLGLVVALLALCGAPASADDEPARPAQEGPVGLAPAASPGAAEAVLQTGRYRGDTIGILYPTHPEMSTLKLPPEMKYHRSLSHAEGWHLVVARRGDDWVILLTDGGGVVTDDVAIVGAASDFSYLHDCGGDVIPALVRADECAGGATTVPATRAWVPRDGKLVKSEQDQILCFCEQPL